ncbi:MAG TPA: lipopolysaccharide biosynthesis protein [Thermodesulfobacteriota bacterium]|nr:lipopolysaccharide biosynthesis protein [Thermodesulfobacteriota bacterium]
MTLKQKTISGLIWSFTDSIANQGISFIVGIILARLLSPKEFGLVGMITIFIAISSSFINSGFESALIQKRSCTEKDFSTVFYFNLAMGFFFFWILFFSAPAISRFFNEPQLRYLIRVLGIVLIIDALTIIQRTTLTKRIDFKLQTKVSIISAAFSGIIALIMAWYGFGVWSLVARQIIQQAMNSLLLWIWNRWWPVLVFSMDSFRQLFSFGSKLLISGLIDTLYRNVYYLIIGKFFYAAELGYYTRAEQFQSLPSSNLQSIIGRVTYPVLSTIQNDIPRLKETYKKIIRSTMLVTFVLMLGLAAVAKPMVLTLIGEKWEPCVIYLQMLCFVGMLYPLHALNLNMLKVQGRSDLFLRLEIIKKALAVPVIVIAVIWGIKTMIFGMILLSLIAYYLNGYWSGRLIGYSVFEQIKDVFPSFMIAAGMSAIVFVEGFLIALPPLALLILQLTTGAVLTFSLCEGFHFKDYLYIKGIVNDKLLRGTQS